MSRWLLDDEKESTLSFWHHTRDVIPETWEVKAQFAAGGYGWPDPAMHPWCDRLNALDGVCTVSSCTGHLIVPEHYSDGHLWVRLGEKVTPLLDETIAFLVSLPSVTTLAKRYFLADVREPWEWLEIEFPGGRETLNENLAPIVSYFEGFLVPE